MTNQQIRVAVNGGGRTGWNVAAAISRQPDMQIVGIRDLHAGLVRHAARCGFEMYVVPPTAPWPEAPAVPMRPTLDGLLGDADVLVDCGPRDAGRPVLKRCRAAGVKVVFLAHEPHAVTGHSFVAEVNYASAVGRHATRIVSSDTAAALRTLTTLHRAGLVGRASCTLIGGAVRHRAHARDRTAALVSRRAQDLVSEARTVVADLNVAAGTEEPDARCHLQSWRVELARETTREEILRVFGSTPRVALVRMSDGVLAELMRDLGCADAGSGNVAVWVDLLAVEGREAFYTCQVFDEAVIVHETVDAVRALAGAVTSAHESIRLTDAALSAGPPRTLPAADLEATRRRRALRLVRGPRSGACRVGARLPVA